MRDHIDLEIERDDVHLMVLVELDVFRGEEAFVNNIATITETFDDERFNIGDTYSLTTQEEEMAEELYWQKAWDSIDDYYEI